MSGMGWADWVGWLAGMVLLVTVSRQVWTQYRTRSAAGVSRWLFTGQVAASSGFVIYSFAKGDVLFVATNLMMLIVAITGKVIDWHNRRRADRPSRDR
jgi:uncharacterized protein with PQ loop repeat